MGRTFYPKQPKYRIGDKVWYVDNATLLPVHGSIGYIVREMDRSKPFSYMIESDDQVHGTVRHEPFIFTEKQECDVFAKGYRDAVGALITAFITRVNLDGEADMNEAKAYLSDLSATLYGQLEAMAGTQGAKAQLKPKPPKDPLTVGNVMKKFDIELRYLRKLMVKYWEGTRDAEEGIVDLTMTYEEWASEYMGDLLHDNLGWESIYKEIQEAITKYLTDM